MSRQLAPSEMALNNPAAPIKAEKPALFKKWLDSFCVGVGEDYWSQTGSELRWITWRACILTDTGNQGTAGTAGGCKRPSWFFWCYSWNPGMPLGICWRHCQQHGGAALPRPWALPQQMGLQLDPLSCSLRDHVTEFNVENSWFRKLARNTKRCESGIDLQQRISPWEPRSSRGNYNKSPVPYSSLPASEVC